MIDLHAHVLAGVDDGVRTLEESVALARSAVADGVTRMAATPHVRADYPTEARTMRRLLAELRGALDSEGIALDVLPGGEIALDRVRAHTLEELREFGLGGNPSYLLVEFPYTGWPLDLPDLLFGLLAGGVTPVLAHPERNDVVQEAPERLRTLVDAGSLVQLTAASVDGRLGRRPERAAHTLVGLGLAHLLASDAHAPEVRASGLSAAARALGDAGLARQFTVEVPAAIVDGGELPQSPLPSARRGWRRRR